MCDITLFESSLYVPKKDMKLELELLFRSDHYIISYTRVLTTHIRLYSGENVRAFLSNYSEITRAISGYYQYITKVLYFSGNPGLNFSKYLSPAFIEKSNPDVEYVISNY